MGEFKGMKAEAKYSTKLRNMMILIFIEIMNT